MSGNENKNLSKIMEIEEKGKNSSSPSPTFDVSKVSHSMIDGRPQTDHEGLQAVMNINKKLWEGSQILTDNQRNNPAQAAISLLNEMHPDKWDKDIEEIKNILGAIKPYCDKVPQKHRTMLYRATNDLTGLALDNTLQAQKYREKFPDNKEKVEELIQDIRTLNHSLFEKQGRPPAEFDENEINLLRSIDSKLLEVYDSTFAQRTSLSLLCEICHKTLLENRELEHSININETDPSQDPPSPSNKASDSPISNDTITNESHLEHTTHIEISDDTKKQQRWVTLESIMKSEESMDKKAINTAFRELYADLKTKAESKGFGSDNINIEVEKAYRSIRSIILKLGMMNIQPKKGADFPFGRASRPSKELPEALNDIFSTIDTYFPRTDMAKNVARIRPRIDADRTTQ